MRSTAQLVSYTVSCRLVYGIRGKRPKRKPHIDTSKFIVIWISYVLKGERWGKKCHALPRPAGDLCLTGLQISTNQRATRKHLGRSIHSTAFRETKWMHVSFECFWVFSSLAQQLFYFACWEYCDTPDQFKDIGLLKLNVLFMRR